MQATNTAQLDQADYQDRISELRQKCATLTGTLKAAGATIPPMPAFNAFDVIETADVIDAYCAHLAVEVRLAQASALCKATYASVTKPAATGAPKPASTATSPATVTAKPDVAKGTANAPVVAATATERVKAVKAGMTLPPKPRYTGASAKAAKQSK